MNRPLVSVIVPVYNGERFLAAALDSIFAQDYRPLEAIVVDDGSVDGTAAIAKSYGEARYIYQPNRGHGAAKNTGVAAASGEFLAFLDADDLWTPNKLAVQMTYLLEHPEIGYVIARMQNFLEAGTEPPLLAKGFLLTDCAGFSVGTLLARRAVFAKVGNFDASYRHANDTDWFFRVKESGLAMTMLPEVLLRRRLHGANLSYETRPMASDFLRAVKHSIDRTRKQRTKPIEEAAAMEDRPLVSVIIPVYNGERHLAEAVGSALKQTYRPIEIVVVDDGSTDRSGQIAQRFGSPVRYCLQTHGGIGAARNRGVDLSRGEYFAFLDADDLWMENKLALQAAALRKDPALDIAFAHVRHFHSPELPQAMRNTIRCPPEAMPGYAATSMLVTRSAFFRVGPFEVSWHVGEFIDWYARALEAGLKSVMLPEAMAERRLHNANQGIVERAAQSDYLRILKAALDRHRETTGQTSGENSSRPGKS